MSMLKSNRRGIIRAAVAVSLVLIPSSMPVAMGDVAYAWGANNAGQLGNGTENTTFPYGNYSTPVPVAQLGSGVSGVAECRGYSLALVNGQIYDWGNGVSPYTPAVGSFNFNNSSVSTTAAGDYHLLAIKNGGLYSSGDNTYGELGYGLGGAGGSVANMSSGVTAASAGAYYSLAVKNGGAYAWGGNWSGQLGNGTTNNGSTPSPVPVVNLSSGVTAIAAGGSGVIANSQGGVGGYASFGLAVQNGALYAWGFNAVGELGNGTTTNSSTPVPVINLSSGVTSIAAGDASCLAVEHGNVFAWGANNIGQLGDGTTNSELIPEEIDPTDLSGITSVATVGETSFALASDGTVWDWGSNEYGLLGLGTTTQYYTTPQHLLPPSGYRFTSIASQGDADSVLATLASIPEPTALSLLALGSIALLARRPRTAGQETT